MFIGIYTDRSQVSFYRTFSPLVKDLGATHEGVADGHTMDKWPNVFTVRAKFENYQNRVSILCRDAYNKDFSFNTVARL